MAIYRLRGEVLPVIYLREVLGLAPQQGAVPGQSGTNIVVLAIGQRRYGLIADGVENTEEIVIKPLRGQLKRLNCYSGATVLGDGGVAVILDVAGIATRSEVLQYRGELMPILRAEALLPLGTPAHRRRDQLLVVFDFGQPVAMAVDQIVDVADVALRHDKLDKDGPYASGKIVVFGKTTLLFDVPQMLQVLGAKYAPQAKELQA